MVQVKSIDLAPSNNSSTMSNNEERKISMNVNGESKVPPGFRFHPTEEELLQYYLRKKVASENIDLDVIQDVDLNKLEPWDIQVKCNIGSTPQNDWYFFSHKDKKYPTGTRTNRATIAGFWKATGRDKAIHSGRQTIGMRKTLVFYQGRAPHGQKSDWIMHEYRLDDIHDSYVSNLCEGGHEEAWVVCRVFKKKNYHKSLLCGSMVDTTTSTREKLQSSSNKDALLDQLLMYMDGSHQSFKQEITDNKLTSSTTDQDAIQQFVNPMNDMHLPGLESPTMTTTTTTSPPPVSSATFNNQESSLKTFNSMMDLLGEAEYTSSNNNNSNNYCSNNKVDDYDHYCADLDKFVASQLDGQMEENKHYCSSFYGEHSDKLCYGIDVHDEQDVWNSLLARSSALSSALMDPLCHFSV